MKATKNAIDLTNADGRRDAAQPPRSDRFHQSPPRPARLNPLKALQNFQYSVGVGPVRPISALAPLGAYGCIHVASRDTTHSNSKLTSWVSLDIENYCTIRASPACQRQSLWFSDRSSIKIKGGDCGTINSHDESSSIRILMKVVREILVR